LNNGIVVANGLGTVDSDYHLEISVLLINLGNESFVVKPKMKIAQGVICPVFQANFIPVEASELDQTKTSRTGGFGSTGL
jgi:dUTP pyrophosphatase